MTQPARVEPEQDSKKNNQAKKWPKQPKTAKKGYHKKKKKWGVK